MHALSRARSRIRKAAMFDYLAKGFREETAKCVMTSGGVTIEQILIVVK